MLRSLALRRLACLAASALIAGSAAAQGDPAVAAAFSRVGADYDAEAAGARRADTGRFFAHPSVYAVDPGPYHGGSGADTTNGVRWAILYDQLALGTASAGISMPSLATMVSRAASWQNAGQVPLSAVYWNYDHIVPGAFDDNRMALDEQGFYRPHNADGTLVNPASPYGTRTLFTGAALTGPDRPAGEIPLQTTFVVPRDLVVLAPEASLVSVEADFGDGAGYRALSLDAPVSVSYPSVGQKTIALRLQVNDRGVIRSIISRTIARVFGTTPPVERPGFSSGDLYDGEAYCGSGTDLLQYLGCTRAGYRYSVWYANPNIRQLKNVLIFTDGYDPGEDTTPQKIFNDLNRPGDDGSLSLAQTLRNQGYDIVILDWVDSKNYIQRNALSLVKLIETVNADVQPRGGRIQAVTGFSMGGLITRYALLKMERDGPAHNIHTFYSFDGAQQGGNVPLGLQYHISHVPGLVSTLAEVFTKDPSPREIAYDFRRPATRQLLSVGKVTVEANHGLADPLRDELFEEIWALGDYPKLARRVAIVNGSGTGRRQYVDERERAVINPSDHMVKQVFKAGMILQIAAVSLEINSWAAPNQSSQIVEENVTRGCTVWPIGCAVVIKRNTYKSPSGVLPYDGAPGGWRGSQDKLDDSFADERWWPATNFVLSAVVCYFAFPACIVSIADVDTKVDIKRHSFITTVSALDYSTDGRSRESLVRGLFLDQNVLLDISSQSAEQRAARTPFDAFYLPGVTTSDGKNQGHVEAKDAAIGAFFVQQLTQPVPDRTVPPLAALITGPDRLLYYEQGTWSAAVSGGSGWPSYRWDYRNASCTGGGPIEGEPLSASGTTGSASGNSGVGKPGTGPNKEPPVTTDGLPCAEWYFKTNDSVLSMKSNDSQFELRLTVTKGSETVVAYKTVYQGQPGGGGGSDPFASSSQLDFGPTPRRRAPRSSAQTRRLDLSLSAAQTPMSQKGLLATARSVPQPARR